MPDDAVPAADVFTDPNPTTPQATRPDEPPTVPPWPAPPGPPPPSPERRSRLRQFVVGALIGGLCGALVATGAFFAFDDDNTTAPAPVQSKTNEVSRDSSTIARNGDIAAIIAKVEPAVVAITVNEGGRQSAGTGFVVSQDGYVATNAHVVAEAQSAKLQFNDGRTLDARVVGRDPSADVAVLKVDGAGNLPVVCTDDSNKVQVGDDVVAIGNALALEGGLSVTRGIISGPPRPGSEIGVAIENVLQTDAAINPGNSGGPLVDADGCVIGINTAVAAGSANQPAQNVGFAIPISHAKPVIEDIEAGRKPAFLGVGTTDLTPELKNQLDVNVDDGAVVEDVTSGSPADDAGIQRGDVIVQIGDVQIKDGGSVATAVRKHNPNEKVTVTYLRGSERKSAEVTLVERPDVR